MFDTLIEKLTEATGAADAAQAIHDWTLQTVLTPASAMQLAAICLALIGGRALSGPLRRGFDALGRRRLFAGRPAVVLAVIGNRATPMAALLLAWIAARTAQGAGLEHAVLDIAVSLLAAWVVIRIAARLVRNRTAARVVAVTAWTLAALDILGLLVPAAALLDEIAFSLGDVRFSALSVVKGLLLLVVLVWLAIVGSNLIERRIDSSADLTPSVKVLLGKLTRIALLTVAILAGVGGVGIDLTAIAVFTGALGFGIGFGMQKIVSNLVSGLILLLDKSVKPGDVIAVGNTYGWVNSMGARYISLVEPDGIELLIPNEELITQRVENWSYSNDLVRRGVEFGISYKSDVRKAMALALEAAAETERVLKDPKPVCFISGFGDSSVNFQLRVWIRDPRNGVSNVKGALLLGLWDKFHEHGIEIPFPQRDLHIRSSETIPVATPPAAGGAA